MDKYNSPVWPIGNLGASTGFSISGSTTFISFLKYGFPTQPISFLSFMAVQKDELTSDNP